MKHKKCTKARVVTAWLSDELVGVMETYPQDQNLALMTECVWLDCLNCMTYFFSEEFELQNPEDPIRWLNNFGCNIS